MANDALPLPTTTASHKGGAGILRVAKKRTSFVKCRMLTCIGGLSRGYVQEFSAKISYQREPGSCYPMAYGVACRGKVSLPRWKVKTMISDKAPANDRCQDENVWVILAALNCFLVRKLMENVGQCHSGTAWEFFEHFEMYD